MHIETIDLLVTLTRTVVDNEYNIVQVRLADHSFPKSF